MAGFKLRTDSERATHEPFHDAPAGTFADGNFADLTASRRGFLGGAGLAALGLATGGALPLLGDTAEAAPLNLPAALPEGVRQNAILDALPGKKPLIKLS
ncbi:MAG: twin-arginine translocation signal domain-containing protein, partial [Pseudolabrys sp.]